MNKKMLEFLETQRAHAARVQMPRGPAFVGVDFGPDSVTLRLADGTELTISSYPGYFHLHLSPSPDLVPTKKWFPEYGMWKRNIPYDEKGLMTDETMAKFLGKSK